MKYITTSTTLNFMKFGFFSISVISGLNLECAQHLNHNQSSKWKRKGRGKKEEVKQSQNFLSTNLSLFGHFLEDL